MSFGQVIGIISAVALSFIVHEPSGIMQCTSEMSFCASLKMYRSIWCSEWWLLNTGCVRKSEVRRNDGGNGGAMAAAAASLVPAVCQHGGGVAGAPAPERERGPNHPTVPESVRCACARVCARVRLCSRGCVRGAAPAPCDAGGGGGGGGAGHGARRGALEREAERERE